MKDFFEEHKNAVLIGAGILLVAVIIIAMVMNNEKKKEEEQARGLTKEEIEAEEDVIPYGDETAKDYEYEGDYFDTASNKGTMTIKKKLLGYDINITYAESNDAMTIWTFSATYDKNRRALRYTDCTKVDYIFEGMDKDDLQTSDTTTAESESVNKTEGYKEGRGWVYVNDEKLFWIDDKEEMGTGLMFEKADEETIQNNAKKAAAESTDKDAE